MNCSAKPLTKCEAVDQRVNAAHNRDRCALRANVEYHAHRARFAGFSVLTLTLMWLLCASASRIGAQSTSTMTVGSPTTDANGVMYYPVTSVYQDAQPQTIRVLQPTNPAPGMPPRILYVLPVDAGVDTTSSAYSDGLEELRLLDVQDLFNMTLIAPSFAYEPWYGDNIADPTRRMESFIVDDLVPFGDTFAQGSVPQRYLIGFSKSGNGALFLILRHPGIFNGAADWDAPAQLSDLNATGISTPGALPMNFGTQSNFDLYNIPSLVSSDANPFQQQNRLWISGDQAAWTADMDELDSQMTAASILHTWVQGGERAHSWNSGWLDGAVTDLDANATLTAPAAGNIEPPRTGGLPFGTFAPGTTQATLSLTTDLAATCRYATTAGVTYDAMTNTFDTTGGTAHATVVTGLQDGGSYSYYVRCLDSATGIVNTDDYAISFSVGQAGSTASSSFSGVEDPLSENGMWDTTSSWISLEKNNGVYATDTDSAARLLTPAVGPDQFAEITYDQDPGTAGGPGVMTRVQGANNGSGYLAFAYDEQVQLYQIDDNGSSNLNFTFLDSAPADLATAPRQLRLESQGSTHRVYFNSELMITYTDASNTYSAGQPGIADSIFGDPTVSILSFTGGDLAGSGGGTSAAAITSPTPGTALPSASTTFNWNAGSGGVTGYYLWVGTSPGTADLVNIGPLSGTSATVNLPTNGAPVYVQLWTVINGATFLSNSYTYTEDSENAAAVTSPTPGTALPSASTTFNWNAGSGGVTGYYLWVGTSPGTADLVNIGPLSGTSATVNLPTNGAPVYVQLWTVINGATFLSNSYTYTEDSENAAAVTSPTPGTALLSAPTTFNWNAGSGGVTGYYLWVGTSPGTADLVNIGPLSGTSATVNLPTNGAPIYVRLWTVINGATFLSNSYTYTEDSENAAAVTSPTPGTALLSAPTTFTWNAGSGGVTGYYLWVGTSPGTADLVNIGPLSGTSATVNLPTNGAPIYVQLWTVINGATFLSNSYTYTEAP